MPGKPLGTLRRTLPVTSRLDPGARGLYDSCEQNSLESESGLTRSRLHWTLGSELLVAGPGTLVRSASLPGWRLSPEPSPVIVLRSVVLGVMSPSSLSVGDFAASLRACEVASSRGSEPVRVRAEKLIFRFIFCFRHLPLAQLRTEICSPSYPNPLRSPDRLENQSAESVFSPSEFHHESRA